MAKMNKRDIENQLKAKQPEAPVKPETASFVDVKPETPKEVPPVTVPKVEAPKPVVLASPTMPVEPSKPQVVTPAPKAVQPSPVPPASKFERDYFAKMSCNYNVKGDWQKQYVKWLQNWFNVAGKRVLDLGCAMGAISSAMADIGAKVLGIDVSRFAKETSKFKNFEHHVGDMTEMKMIADKSVDRVHAMSVFECLEHSKFMNVLKEIARVLAINGLAFIVASDHDIDLLAKSLPANLINITEKMKPEMMKHFEQDFMGKYKWAVLVLERK